MSDEVVTTPFGKFLVDPEDCIGGTLKAGTIWDGPGFLQVLGRQYGRFGVEGISIIDVGANFGSFTVWAASQGAWRVIAVEPMPETLRYLKATLDLNKETCADRVVLLPIAGYDRFIEMESRDFSRRNIGGASVVPAYSLSTENDKEVPVVPNLTAAPLDAFNYLFGNAVSFIKVDGQGCDGAVLMGLEHTIRRDKPVIVFEWEERLAGAHGYTLAQIYDWLEGLGYKVNEWPSHPSNHLALPDFEIDLL